MQYIVQTIFSNLGIRLNFDIHQLVIDVALSRLADKPFVPQQYSEIIVDNSLKKEDNNIKAKEEKEEKNG